MARKAEIIERARDWLCLSALETEEEVPDLSGLTIAELEKIIYWCAMLHFEASDNPCRARHAPKSLRELMPKDHWIRRWRMPKRRGRDEK